MTAIGHDGSGRGRSDEPNILHSVEPVCSDVKSALAHPYHVECSCGRAGGADGMLQCPLTVWTPRPTGMLAGVLDNLLNALWHTTCPWLQIWVSITHICSLCRDSLHRTARGVSAYGHSDLV
jgi:hypothetical protein